MRRNQVKDSLRYPVKMAKIKPRWWFAVNELDWKSSSAVGLVILSAQEASSPSYFFAATKPQCVDQGNTASLQIGAGDPHGSPWPTGRPDCAGPLFPAGVASVPGKGEILVWQT
jgi:hypothetical protein